MASAGAMGYPERGGWQGSGEDDPPSKRARYGDAGDAGEPPDEQEQAEAETSQGPAAKTHGEEVGVDTRDCTLNVIPTLGGRILAPLSDGGFQYLLAGARANVGVKAGRHCYEVKIVELHNPTEPPRSDRGRMPLVPRQFLRLGFSPEGSSLFLGESAESISFDSEGGFTAGGQSTPATQRFGRDQVLTVVLNLDSASPNANTVSLFRNGARVSRPQQLPESLKGKTLFPHVTFKNVTLQVNWGPSPMVPLPFACRMIQGAAAEDAVVAAPPAGGRKNAKYEVVLPVGVPDEGTFDWLDLFLEKNPHYTELSDRKIFEWAEKSGLRGSVGPDWKHSSDKPEVSFGFPLMDDFSVQRMVRAVAPSQPRDYVVMEVRGNLLKNDRSDVLARFAHPCYRRVAQIVTGEPTDDFKSRVYDALLKEKQERLDIQWRERQADLEASRRQREMEAAAAQAQAPPPMPPPDMGEAAMTDQQPGGDAAMKVEGGDDGVKKEEGEPKAEVKDEAAGEVKKEEPTEGAAVKKEEEAAGAQAAVPQPPPEEEDEPRPVATLTDEEKLQWFPKKRTPDIQPLTLSRCFARFSLPEKEEGFDEVRYAWSQAGPSKDYLKAWILKQKITTKVEDLQPSEWFRSKWMEWLKVLQTWHTRQNDYKDRAPLEAQLQQQPPQQPAEEPQAGAEAPPAALDAAAAPAEGAPAVPGAEGGQEPAAAGADATVQPPAAEGGAEAAAAPPKEEAEVDIFAFEDINDIGNGEPLYSKFTFEDWALLSLRFELHLMAHAFKRDVGDPERPGIHEQHLPFYYHKYLRKTMSVKYYGVSTHAELVELVRDTITINEKSEVLEPQLSDDMDNFDIFVKLTEENRRERQRRIDAGDATAKLQFAKPQPPAYGERSMGEAGYGQQGYQQPMGYQGARGYEGGGYEGQQSGGYDDQSWQGHSRGGGSYGTYGSQMQAGGRSYGTAQQQSYSRHSQRSQYSPYGSSHGYGKGGHGYSR